MNAALYTLLFTTGYREVICRSPKKLHVFLGVTHCWTEAAIGPGEVSDARLWGTSHTLQQREKRVSHLAAKSTTCIYRLN